MFHIKFKFTFNLYKPKKNPKRTLYEYFPSKTLVFLQGSLLLCFCIVNLRDFIAMDDVKVLVYF